MGALDTIRFATGSAMGRFFRIFAVYALIAAAVFVLQWIPQTGIFLMLLLGMFWIGVLVHAFMIQITVMSIVGALPRPILILPATFYAAGLAWGLSSEIPASRWQSQQQWLRIDKQIPPQTRDLSFTNPINHVGLELMHQDSAFRPERFGFELFATERPYHRLIFRSDANPWCPSGQVVLGDRCFATEPIERPSSYVLIGQSVFGGSEGDCPTGVLKFWWATIYPDCEPIKLLTGESTDIIGRLTGAVIRKRSYLLFPTAGCALLDSPPGWPCQWYLSPLWRDAYVGYHMSPNGSSPTAASILMSALAQLRGQTVPP
jgi:hypothetical protein